MKNKLTILLVITKGSWGGATKYVYDLAVGLTKRGHTVHVAYGAHGILPAKLNEAGISHTQVPGLERDINILKEVRSFFGLYNIIQDLSPDIVHVNSSKAGGLGALAARLQKVPCVVFTSHGWAFNERRNILAQAIIKLVYFLTMHLAHRTIAVSRAIYDQVAKWPTIDTRLDLITHGIHPVTASYTKMEAREILTTHDPSLKQYVNETWVMTVAELHDSKGIDIMLSALASINGNHAELPHYIVVGDGGERWKLESLIDSYGLNKYVHLVGFVPDAAQYMKAADVFVLPSRTEALGYVLLEAGSLALPVIASRIGGIPEIITHEETGLLVPPESPSVLVIALEELLSDEKKSQLLGKRLRSQILTLFSMEHMVKKTEKVYLTQLPQ